ncbi:hypothetical protein Syun_024307 [Stephania yunnanensis]|uniref:Cytochrome P450 n=1 Tax=Stephania yunnanensis TaxID=152371 RepID=A0AAP0NKK9_9MAGN
MSQDIRSRCILGKDYGEDNEKRLHEIARNVSVLLGAFSFQDFYPGFGWLDYVTGLVSRLNKTANELDAHIDEVVEQHIETKKLGETDRQR